MRRFTWKDGGAPLLLLAILSASVVGWGHSVSFFWVGPLLLVGFVWLIWMAWRGEGAWKAGFFFAAFGMTLLLQAVYYLNPAYRWPEGGGIVPVNSVRFLPAAAFPSAVPGVMALFATGFVVCGLAMHLSRRQAGVLMACILGGAAVTAIVVLEQRLTPRPFPIFERTGFFHYENHYAAFANLMIPPTLFYGERLSCRAWQRGSVCSPAIFCYMAAALSVAAILVSGSRAGMVIAGVMVALCLFRQGQLRRRYPFATPENPLPAKVAIGLIAGGISGALVFAGVRGLQSISNMGGEIGFRWQVIIDTLSIWRDRPAWGIGPGSFAAVFPFYQSHPVERFFFRHAHCEPVEFLAEYGLLGGGILLLVVLVGIFFSVRRGHGNSSHPSFCELEGSGFLLALIAIGLHSLVDFPFRHPSNALLCFLWLGLLARAYGGGWGKGHKLRLGDTGESL